MSDQASLYPLAAALARPVARGHLTRTQADASLLAATLAAKRLGRMPYDVRDVYRGLRHILTLHLEKEGRRRAMTEHRIQRCIRSVIEAREPSRTVLAEAHHINGADGFPLDEHDVTAMAVVAMRRAVRWEGRANVR